MRAERFEGMNYFSNKAAQRYFNREPFPDKSFDLITVSSRVMRRNPKKRCRIFDRYGYGPT
jgi:hypothetical protein